MQSTKWPENAAPSSANVVTYLTIPRPSTFVPEWYDCATEDHFWMQWRFRSLCRAFAQSEIPTEDRLRVMDVGGGLGVVRQQLERATAWRVDCVDLNENALKRAKTGRGDILYYDLNEKRKEYLERYDVILLLDVLEHIPSRPVFLDSVVAHLKPGGWLVINVPACQALFSEYDLVAGHLLRYDKPTLKAELEKRALRDIKMNYWGGLLLPLLVARTAILKLRRTSKHVIQFGFSPPNRLADSILRILMRAEISLGIDPMIGTSLIGICRKPRD